MRTVGPIRFKNNIQGDIKIPLATFETPLWPSVQRGARITRACDGLSVQLLSSSMTRSILIEATDATSAHQCWLYIDQNQGQIAELISKTSRFATLTSVDHQQVGRLLYLRLTIDPGDAAGHNMVTKAADALLQWLPTVLPVRQVSISANYCTDKKVSAVNGILGRGKSVVADLVIPRAICEQQLRATPEQISELNTKKNLLGSTVAGSLRSANAHYANMLLAFYLATGQDAANIVEGSQGISFAETQDGDLYFSVTLPNIIVGTVGNGKDLPFVQDNLTLLGCADTADTPGQSAKRLAMIAAAVVWCGELSLLAAQVNPGELIRSHMVLERA